MIHFSCVEGQTIAIGDMTVKVLEIDGDDVLLEIDAPDGTAILSQHEQEMCLGVA